MKRYFVSLGLALIIFLLIPKQFAAQDLLNSIPLKFSTYVSSSVLPIVDDTNNTHLVFFSKQQIKVLKYDENFVPGEEMLIPQPPSNFKQLLGYALTEDQKMNLYFSNKKRNRFYLISLGPNGSIINKDFEFKLKDEKFLECINYGSRFHILTRPRLAGTQTIKRYTFENEKYTSTTYDFAGKKFYRNDYSPISFSQVFTSETEVIDGEVPSSIDMTSKEVKIYPRGNKLIITLDHENNSTKAISLNLEEDGYEITDYMMKVFSDRNQILESNSFVHNDRLYQLSLSVDSLWLRIKDLYSKETLKEYKNDKEGEITFKNSAIYQEKNTFFGENTRELEQSKQFLRKMRRSEVGVSVFETGNTLQLSIGGLKEVKGGGAPMMMPMPMAGIPMGPVMMTPTFGAYQSYGASKAVFIKSLLDLNTLEHVEGDVGNNVFDNISDFTEDMEGLELETTFTYKDFLVYGYYKRGEYHLHKFKI